jgi:hypothetical protein
LVLGLRFHSLPPLRPQSPRIGFWRRRPRILWALTEKARRHVYCPTGLQASWSELAYVRPLSASETEPVFSCTYMAWVVVSCNKAPQAQKIWGVAAGERGEARRECREKGLLLVLRAS